MRLEWAAAALLLASGRSSADDALARDLVRRIEQRHAQARDLVAQFSQSYRSGLLGRAVVERGRVSILHPGRMRWEYQEPERKIFVSDGRVFYFYVPADRQVIVREEDMERSLAGRLLCGRGGLLDEFEASLDSPLDEGVFRIRLTPRREEAEMVRAFVDAEPGGRVRALLLEDVQGNLTEFRFENIRENVGLEERLFRFEVPSGVDVIHG